MTQTDRLLRYLQANPGASSLEVTMACSSNRPIEAMAAAVSRTTTAWSIPDARAT